MILHILILLIAVSSLIEMRRQEKQITARFIERGRQQIPENIVTAKEDEKSLRAALHGSRVGIWLVIGICAVDFIGQLFTHE